MGKLFGVDIKGLLDKNVAPGLRPALLSSITRGARGADLTGGRSRDSTSHRCRGIWIDYDNSQIDGKMVLVGDRKALLMMLRVPPKPEDEVTIDSITLTVERLEKTDPVGATYVVQCRDRKLKGT